MNNASPAKSLTIRKIKMADIWAAPNCVDLLREYAEESSIEGLPTPTAKKKLYDALEVSGNLHALGAFIGSEMIGFIIVLNTPATHYDITLFTTESFFVSKLHRATGAGLKLLNEAEKFAKDNNACGLLISAPAGGRLASVLERREYKETNRVFFKRLS